MKLTELFALGGRDKYCTDKGDDHSYLAVYDELFAPYKNKPIIVVEIGIASGGSLCLLQDYFINANIIGIDRYPCVNDYLGNRVRNLQMDFKEFYYGGVDIVIDDASHHLRDQLWVVENVLPLINKGGMLVIEDVMSPQYIMNHFEALGKEFELIDMNDQRPDMQDNVLLIYKK